MLTIWLLGLAQADVASEPESCPAGAVPVSAHGPYCAPGTCNDCPGEPCKPVGLCVIDEQRPCGGMSGGDCMYRHIEALSSCETQADCAEGTCIVAGRCAARQCGCASGLSAATGLALLALLPWITRKRTAFRAAAGRDLQAPGKLG